MKKSFLACLLLFSLNATLNAQSNTQLLKATNEFLLTLSDVEMSKTIYAFDNPARLKWTNLPVGMEARSGIQYGSLTDKSRLAYHRVLTAMLSSQGYLKTTSIMQLDDILNMLYQQAFDDGKISDKALKGTQNLKWAHGNYYIAIFGKPADNEPWGLNFGGHHMALSMTSDGKKISMSPYFIGTDPSEVKSGKYAGLRILSKEEDLGFMLVQSMSTQQKALGVLNRAVPKDIITNPKSSQRIDSNYGIQAKQFTKDQKEILQLLIQEFVHNFEHEKAHQLMDKIIKSGIEKIYFAWIGSLENNKPHYYILNGPDFLIEYDNVGFGNDGNHIHAILREKGNDFGADILKQHYLDAKH